MKILYNDRKERLNWGARSTGKALYQLIAQKHEIISEFDRPIYVTSSTYDSWSRKILSQYNYFIVKWAITALRFFVSWFTDLTKANVIVFDDVDKTAEAILKYQDEEPYLKKIISDLKIADALVINGEGSMIFGNPTRAELFFFFALLNIAKSYGKKTFYINAIASQNSVTDFNATEFEAFKKHIIGCDKIIVRDPVSFNFLKERDIKDNLLYCPDSLFAWFKYIEQGLQKPFIGDTIVPFPDKINDYGVFDFSQPYICVGGSSYFLDSGRPEIYSANSEKRKITINNYVRLVEKLKTLGKKVFLIESCDRDDFLWEVSQATQTPIIPTRINLIQAISILANAEVFISGRYHPTIMASLGGTPCILLDSNSHKTYSIQLLLEYKEPKIYHPELSDEIIEYIYNDCQALLLEGTHLREKIKTRVKQLSINAQKIVDYLDA